MKYQLVLQLPASLIDDYDTIIELEESIETVLGLDHILDGHDFGSGEMNIFIHTNNLDIAFNSLKKAGVFSSFDSFTAAYRAFTSEEYKVIWPCDFKGSFSVV